jgi:hypothetical protein
MCDTSVHIATFPSGNHESSLEANEQHAIANYDYEQAQLIVESRQKRQRHPSVDEIDADYRAQFKQAFQELIDQHEAFKAFLSERQRAADETPESEDNVEAAYASVEIMDTALCDDKNPDVTLPVLKHFSPRRKVVQALVEKRTMKRQGK